MGCGRPKPAISVGTGRLRCGGPARARIKNGTPSTHSLIGYEMRALRRLLRESQASPFVFVNERGSPFTTAGFARMIVTGLSIPPRARTCSERYWRRLLISGGGAVVTSTFDARNEARNEGGTYQRVEVITASPASPCGRSTAASEDPAVELQQVERVQHCIRSLVPAVQRSEHGDAVRAGDHGLAVYRE
jgi:hypothetical protein